MTVDLASLPGYEPSFELFTPITFFMKNDGPEDRRLRHRGVATDERKDREDETVFQRGLDWSEFLDRGWINDNHSKAMADVLGFPEIVDYYSAGAALPDGKKAEFNCHWIEGYLLRGYAPAERVFELGIGLQKSGSARRLGYSIEGKILRRAGVDGKIIAKAKVRHLAITHCPVNPGAYMEAVAKAITDAEKDPAPVSPSEHAELHERIVRALADPKAREVLVRALDSVSGAALGVESLDARLRSASYPLETLKSEQPARPAGHVTRDQAIRQVITRFPGTSPAMAERIVGLISQGRLAA